MYRIQSAAVNQAVLLRLVDKRCGLDLGELRPVLPLHRCTLAALLHVCVCVQSVGALLLQDVDRGRE